MTEREYRAVPRNSSSSLKEFSVDKRKYRKTFILKERAETIDGDAVMMGNLVETLLMEPERFDDLFYMSACATTPAPATAMGKFVEALAKYTVAATDVDTGVVKEDFMTMVEKAHVDSQYKIKIPAVLKKFEGSDAEIYYEELVKVRFNKLTVITPNDVNNAERVVMELQTNPITATIVNLKSGSRFEVYNQMKVTDFEIDGMPMKSMLDKVIVDHVDKTIQFYDLKCTWSVEKFYKEYYLFRRAYIQAYVYNAALKYLTTVEDTPFYKYEVLLPRFLVCDSINYYSPLIYVLTEKDMKEAYEGFETRGYKYPGVKQIIQDLFWANGFDTWNISKENFLNNGLVKLKY